MAEDPATLRSRHRAWRRALPAAEQRRAAAAVAAMVVDRAERHRWTTVLAYLDHAGELPTGPAIAALERRGVVVGLPRVDGDELHFHRVRPGAALDGGPFGIPAPGSDLPAIAALTVDAALVPLVAFDDQGSRLGMGGGFYDRFLARYPQIARIGLAHDAQRVSRLPRQRWDQPLDVVLTATMVLTPPRRRAADSPL